MRRAARALPLVVGLAGCAPTVPAPATATATATATPTPASFALPGARGSVTVDYIANDRARGRVWVPVGETGSVDVLDAATGTMATVTGFPTAEREAHGKTRTMGPSAVTLGDGVAYVGDRASSEVCAVVDKTLARGACVKLPTPTDGVAYVASVKEVWVTTPGDHSLTVLDASTPDALKAKLTVRTDGNPEGYAVDSTRGLFYTNLEDKDRTLAIDVRTHAVKATWSPGCGAEGPRGIAVDEARNFVLVACTDGVRVLDGAHDGAPLGKLETGAGVDNIDYVAAKKTLVVAAGKASRLTLVGVSDQGALSVVGELATAQGARNAVADDAGNVYVVDPGGARLLVYGHAFAGAGP